MSSGLSLCPPTRTLSVKSLQVEKPSRQTSHISKTGGSEVHPVEVVESATTREMNLNLDIFLRSSWPSSAPAGVHFTENPFRSFFTSTCANPLCQSGSRVSLLQQCRRVKDTIFVLLSVCECSAVSHAAFICSRCY